ncbi:type IV pilus assembly protein PilM [Candidatus Saccharibacteria bacterium]|nr:type IV pilus assembly protein PilM [Candidatus Saccharibacteria bacterium]
MNILSGVSDFFGLDIGSTALRAVLLRGTGPIKALERYYQMPIDSTITLSDSNMDQQKLAGVIKDFIHKSGISSKNVAVNLPSHRVFTTVVDMDKMPMDELAKAIHYQAESFIPTNPDQSKVDWAVIGDSPKDPKKLEILLTSVPNEFVERRLDLIEAIGLNVIAFEPDSIALARAVVPVDLATPQLILDVGSKATDLVIAMNGAPHLSRAIPVGSEAIIRTAMQNLSIDQAQAEQFIFKFGLGKDKVEGQIYSAIIGTIDNLMSEIEKSIKFFQSRYPNTKLERIIVTGGASSMPELPLHIANRFGISVEIGNAWRNVSFPSSKQNELLAVSNHFAVAVGLAERAA